VLEVVIMQTQVPWRPVEPALAGVYPNLGGVRALGWTASLLGAARDAGWRAAARRLGVGLGLASLYGLALGTRYGALAMAWHALGVPLGLAASALLAAPAFYILLAHVDFPIDGLAFASSVSRAAATGGLALAGLAPAAALLTASTEGPVAAALYGALGLVVAGSLALRGLHRELSAAWQRSQRPGGLAQLLATLGFSLFASLLTARIWWLTLPMLGGPMPGGSP